MAGASPAAVGLADAVKPKDDRQTALVQDGGKALGDKEQVALHQADGNRVAGCFQDAKAGCLGDGLFAAALLLLCLECRIRRGPLLAGVVNWAIGIRAHLVNGADVAAFGDDGVGGELAHLELRALGIFLLLGLVVADRGVLVARQNWTAFLLPAVCRADLHKVGLGGNGLRHVRRRVLRCSSGDRCIGRPACRGRRRKAVCCGRCAWGSRRNCPPWKQAARRAYRRARLSG